MRSYYVKYKECDDGPQQNFILRTNIIRGQNLVSHQYCKNLFLRLKDRTIICVTREIKVSIDRKEYVRLERTMMVYKMISMGLI